MCLDNPTLPKITAMAAGWPACAKLLAVAPAGQPTRYTTPGDVTALIFNLQEFTGNDAGMKVTVDQATLGDLSFLVEWVPPAANQLSDLRGIFIELANETLLSGTFSILAGSITANGQDVIPLPGIAVCQGNDTLDQCGDGQNNVNGSGLLFDLATAFGSNGIGTDDIQSIGFTLAHIPESGIGQFF